MVAADHDWRFRSPDFTISLNANPKRWRSPRPTQQMRAGRPWKAMRCLAISSQLCRCLSCGMSSLTFASVLAMSSGSPESATQRKDRCRGKTMGGCRRARTGGNQGVGHAVVFVTWRMLLP